jgi:transposase
MLIPLRDEFDAAGLRAAARDSKDAGQTRRLLALAAICDGCTRTEAARIGDVTLQIVRDWVMKLNAHGPAGLVGGKPRRLDATHRAALAAAVESGLIPAVHDVVRWRIVDFCQWLYDEFQVSVSEQTLSRELRELGYRKLTARPRHHAQADGMIEAFKKISPRAWTRSHASRASIAAM